VSVRVVSLASGSKGNAYLVESDGESILVDCGICYRSFRNLEFSAILLTHSHSDHVSGLSVLLKHRDVPVYANDITAEATIREGGLDASRFVCFENGQTFDVGGFSVSPFPIPHDTGDPVGYLIRAGGETYFHGTDIGTPLDSIGRCLAEADVATLESNHDPVMLRTSGRARSLIERIAGPRGHLSNDEACGLVRRFASPRLKRLALAHLSHDCNSPLVAERTMRETLMAMGRTDLTLKILSQDEVVEL